MGKSVYIAEKPSVAQEFAKALKLRTRRGDGYLESEEAVITWCVGHLVTMSYPEVYDEKYKRWSLATLPFLPKEFKYEVIKSVKKQFSIVSGLLNREDVSCIYVCTDSGREGEYIYRLVAQMADVKGKDQKRVWIDSQTEEEILRGIREAKDISAYDNLSSAAYLRAKEDYLMGINFSRLLTLEYGNSVANFLGTRYSVISVGRVMTCVLGMVVRREREIREFVKTPFYRVLGTISLGGASADEGKPAQADGSAGNNQPTDSSSSKAENINSIEAEWRALEGSRYFGTPDLYKENGFKTREKAKELIDYLKDAPPMTGEILSIARKTEKKNPPLLYNLAELQNQCSKQFKISPNDTLNIVQELYEKKLVTYPRTDARVLSSAVAKEIHKNLNGLSKYEFAAPFLKDIQGFGSHKNLVKTRYVNDKQITDHYAIIPTGQGIGTISRLSPMAKNVYDTVVKRFLSIFYPPAEYKKVSLVAQRRGEQFFATQKMLTMEGYLKVVGTNEKPVNPVMFEALQKLRKGSSVSFSALQIKEGETSPPKRYNSGSLILAMENAGQLIEDEELRAQIKGSGIGTSATRADILEKLFKNKYLSLNKKTQIITPDLQGEMIFDVVEHSIKSLLNPELTASWEKGLTYVAEGSITSEEYMTKLENFIKTRTQGVLGLHNQSTLRACYQKAAAYYKTGTAGKTAGTTRK